MDEKSSNEVRDYFAVRTTAMIEDLKRTPSSMSMASDASMICVDLPTSCLTRAHLLWVQRLVMTEQDVVQYGIRSVDVWLGGSSPETAIFKPVPHTEISENLDRLIKNWVTNYEAMRAQDLESVISSIAAFHYEFLRIHPFLDGNGRVARALLRQQVIELVNVDVPSVFAAKPNEYYESLKCANSNDLGPLTKLLKSSIVEFAYNALR